MAGRNNNKLTKVQSDLRYIVPFALIGTSDFYVDVAKGLSAMNRKLFSSEYCYHIKNISTVFTPSSAAAYDQIEIKISTAGDTWSVHNAWTKAKALHSEMQDLVLEDNPSLAGKWSEFKVFLDEVHPTGNELDLIDANTVTVLPGEWNYSTFVLPQHDVDAATGLPLAALEVTSHLIGPDTPTSRGLVKAYAESRATVQPSAPAVPAAAPTSFYNLLTDSGSQEPELALVIIDENDEPPYHPTSYPGGGNNATAGWIQSDKAANAHMVNLNTGAFQAQCGLLRIRISASLNGSTVNPPPLAFQVELGRGSYKGINATHMGQ